MWRRSNCRSSKGGMGAARLRPSNRALLPQPHSARKQKGPARGPFCFLAERVAIFSHPRISEKVQNSFEVLHLAESLR
jgi:hypothetical protein